MDPTDAYATWALGGFGGADTSSVDSRRSSASSRLMVQVVPEYPMADVHIADARLVVGNGVPGLFSMRFALLLLTPTIRA